MISINKKAAECEALEIATNRLTTASSPKAAMNVISAHWRELSRCNPIKSSKLPQWTEQEIEGAKVVMATLVYLRRLGCCNVEKLLKDVIDLESRSV